MAPRKPVESAEDQPQVTMSHAPFVIPARAVREGRSAEGFGPDQLGSMKAYRFLDVLNYAYTKGFQRFDRPSIEVVATPGGPMAVVTACAIFHEQDRDESGRPIETRHYGIGDGSKESISNAGVAKHFVRMAETRAQGRALARALNLDANFEFEMDDFTNPQPAAASTGSSSRGSFNSQGSNSNGGSARVEATNAPPPNDGDGYKCEVCGDKLMDTAKSSAAKKAEWSASKNNGKILCWTHQQEAKAA